VSRRFLTLALVGAALALAGLLAAGAFGDAQSREIRRVRQRLLKLAEAASFQEKDPPFAKLRYADRVTGYFATETEFDLQMGQRSPQGTFTRSQLHEGAAALRASGKGLSVEFIDIAVQLTPTPTQATAHLTSKIYFVGDPDYFVQEFRVGLEKSTNSWLVRRLETVRTMEP
jgi:hypothetical protein